MTSITWTGEQISTPGVYTLLPIQRYHAASLCAGFSISHTGLDRLFMQSAAHFWDKCPDNPDHEPTEPTEAMILGAASHKLYLGERGFQKQFIRRPDKVLGEAWHGNRTVCKDWLKDQAHKGLTVLKSEQIEKIAGMKVSLSKEPLIQAGILQGRVEQSFVWQDAETGIWLKARPDVLPNDTGDFVDLKCVASVSDDALERSIGDFGYHRQAGLVLEGAHQLLGLDYKAMSFTLVFVETSRPFCVEVCTLKPSDIERGMAENRSALRLLKRCLDTNDFPGPSGRQKDARFIGLRSYVIDRNTYRVNQIEAMLRIGKPQITEQA